MLRSTQYVGRVTFSVVSLRCYVREQELRLPKDILGSQVPGEPRKPVSVVRVRGEVKVRGEG